jgi:phospholipid/cholesterol/gamma-HCH transport system substrate-binding protein
LLKENLVGKTRLKVGLFVTTCFFILAAAILWLAGSRFLQPVDVYHIIFSKSVSGLLPGAAVEYQGVTVGKVDKLHLTTETPPRVDVTIALEPGTPVRQDTTALLVGSLVTGIRIIELEGGSASAPPLEPGGTIPVQGGEFEEFRDRASMIAERLANVLTRIEQDLLSPENSAALSAFLRNVAHLSESLRISLDDISTPESRASLKTMVDNIAQAAAGIHGVTKALSDIRGDMYNDGKAMIMQVRQTAAVTATLAKEVTQLTQHLDELVGQNKQEINRALLNLAETSRRLKETAEALQHDPSELIWGRRLPEKEIPDK